MSGGFGFEGRVQCVCGEYTYLVTEKQAEAWRDEHKERCRLRRKPPDADPRLVYFLFQLLHDVLPLGKIEELVANAERIAELDPLFPANEVTNCSIGFAKRLLK